MKRTMFGTSVLHPNIHGIPIEGLMGTENWYGVACGPWSLSASEVCPQKTSGEMERHHGNNTYAICDISNLRYKLLTES
jgi:hypothetical protein